MKKLALGFSLIELLVVISIIGLLTTLAVSNFNQIRTRARDTQRKSDLKQYSTSLESFANLNNGLYPSYTTVADVTASGGLCTKLAVPNCPDDPLISADDTYQHYKYIALDGTGNGNPDATAYSLWADLESGTSDFWILCSNGKVGLGATQPSQSNICPI